MHNRSLFAFITMLGVAIAAGADWPQWRGPNRDGISREKGLLKEWPEGGPKLVWEKADLGDGYSTPAVSDGRIFLINNKDLEDEYVQALNEKDGERIWKTHLGKVGNPDQRPPYPGARSTPTVDGQWVYALGSDGDLLCVDAATGKQSGKKVCATTSPACPELGRTPSLRSSMATPLSSPPAVKKPRSSHSTKIPAT